MNDFMIKLSLRGLSIIIMVLFFKTKDNLIIKSFKKVFINELNKTAAE